MKKKFSLMISALVIVISLLSGCGQKDKAVTLTAFSQLANYSGEMTGWLAQVLLEKFNVKIIVIPDTGGAYDTRMESGDLGDLVVWGNDGEDYLNAVDAGLLFDWNEDDILSEYGQYIKEHMPKALEKNMEISGGTLYGFGHNVATSSKDHEAFFYTWDLRWDLYKELGYPEIKDLNDYLDVLTRMKEINPVDEAGNPTYAASLWPDWDGAMVMYIKSMATAYYGYDELGLGLYNVETGEFYDALGENSPYLEMLNFFNQLYQRDLVDPDSITQTFDEAISKVKNGGTFFSIFNFSGSDAYNTNDHIAENKMMYTYTPKEATPITYGMNVKGGNRVWSIGAKTQYPELVMEIINWLATPEGRMISEYGPKGVTWDYDVNKNTYGTQLGKAMHNDQDTEFPVDSGYSGKFRDGTFQINNTTWSIAAINPDSNGERYDWDFWKSNQSEPINDLEADWREFTGKINTQDFMEGLNYKVALGTSFSDGRKSDELKVKWEQVTKTIKDYSWKAMYAKNDAEFAALVNQMVGIAKLYGYEQCVEWSLEEAARRKILEDEVRGH